jgi:hypothetical protein
MTVTSRAAACGRVRLPLAGLGADPMRTLWGTTDVQVATLSRSGCCAPKVTLCGAAT